MMTNYLSNKLLNHTLRNVAFTSPATVYLALFTVIPDANAAGGTEVTGGSYARQALAFGAAVDGLMYNSTVLTFPAMPACSIVGAGIFDAASAGNLLFIGRFSYTGLIAAATDLSVQIGDVVEVLH